MTGGSTPPTLPDLSLLTVKTEGNQGVVISLNGTSAGAKSYRQALVKLFQKLNLLERPAQLETVLGDFPDSEGKVIALAIADKTYGGKVAPETNIGAVIDQGT